jgi:RNA polymerase sigma-70 factor (sigma-E family)
MDRGARDDEVEFDRYVRGVRSHLLRQAYALCHDRDEADDLVQATLSKIYCCWHRLGRRDELAAYARQTLLRTYVAERRRARWRYEEHRIEPPDGACVLPPVEARMALIAALRKLGMRQRAVVFLRFWSDLSTEQTAEVLGCSPGTVRSQTHRALTTLRATLVIDGWP